MKRSAFSMRQNPPSMPKLPSRRINRFLVAEPNGRRGGAFLRIAPIVGSGNRRRCRWQSCHWSRECKIDRQERQQGDCCPSRFRKGRCLLRMQLALVPSFPKSLLPQSMPLCFPWARFAKRLPHRWKADNKGTTKAHTRPKRYGIYPLVFSFHIFLKSR